MFTYLKDTRNVNPINIRYERNAEIAPPNIPINGTNKKFSDILRTAENTKR